MTTRRSFLKLLGGGSILAAGGTGAFLATRTPTAALAPWTPAAYSDPRKAALSYAILAPNPHNRQPWLIELVGQDSVRIYRDKDRDLPMTDPHQRQLTIGLGAFLETMTLAASAQGQEVDLDLYPEGEDGPVAYAVFRQGGAPDPLAAHILNRHSTKTPYTDRRLNAEEAGALGQYATLIRDDAQVAELREMTKRAFQIEVMTPRTFQESVDLMRIGKAEINANPDGIELREPLFEALRITGLLRNDMLADTSHPGNQAFLADYLTMLDATPHFAVLSSATNTRLDQIEAGRTLMRLYLQATEMGVGLHPVSQALQEFPEMADEYALAHRLLVPEGHTVQMLLRVGFGSGAIPTPRWPLESRIMNGT
ncbi:Acg family FMN-binding oxidoreductase [Primorskyibacter sp. S187A]|uniref:Acg family FMN-binding oxidoreductase n=1 Tax=Primorskyibacter sp. S187A TaxID=3415130 RepID=UPI003C7D62A7